MDWIGRERSRNQRVSVETFKLGPESSSQNRERANHTEVCREENIVQLNIAMQHILFLQIDKRQNQTLQCAPRFRLVQYTSFPRFEECREVSFDAEFEDLMMGVGGSECG